MTFVITTLNREALLEVLPKPQPQRVERSFSIRDAVLFMAERAAGFAWAEKGVNAPRSKMVERFGEEYTPTLDKEVRRVLLKVGFMKMIARPKPGVAATTYRIDSRFIITREVKEFEDIHGLEASLAQMWDGISADSMTDVLLLPEARERNNCFCYFHDERTEGLTVTRPPHCRDITLRSPVIASWLINEVGWTEGWGSYFEARRAAISASGGGVVLARELAAELLSMGL